MIEREVSLRHVGADDEAIIHDWYLSPHVSGYCRPLAEAQPPLGRRVIVSGQHRVGYLEWRKLDPLPALDGEPAIMDGIEVQIIIGAPGAVGHGIGTLAMSMWIAAISLVEARPDIVACVPTTNPRAREFLERLGFRRRNLRIPAVGTPEVVLIHEGRAPASEPAMPRGQPASG